MTLSRLSFFSSCSVPSWDLPFVRGIFDFSSVVETIATRFEEVKRTSLKGNRVREEDHINCYDKYARKLKQAKNWFDSRVKNWEKERLQTHDEGIATEQRDDDTGVGEERRTSDGVIGCEMLVDPPPFEGFDDEAFWLDLGGNWGDGMGFSNDACGS